MAITGLVLGYIQIALIPVLAILAAIAVPAFTKVQEKAEQMKSQNNARQILMACKIYAADHGGAFPPSLDKLVEEQLIVDGSVLQTVPPSEDGEAIGFEYVPGLTETDSVFKVMLQSKITYPDGKKVFGFVDGSVQVAKPDSLPVP